MLASFAEIVQTMVLFVPLLNIEPSYMVDQNSKAGIVSVLSKLEPKLPKGAVTRLQGGAARESALRESGKRGAPKGNSPPANEPSAGRQRGPSSRRRGKAAMEAAIEEVAQEEEEVVMEEAEGFANMTLNDMYAKAGLAAAAAAKVLAI